MGYDLHITRKSYWAEKQGPEITLEEWLDVVENDLELTWSELNRKTSPYLADWSGPGKYSCWLDYSLAAAYSTADLYSKNPTEEMIDKIVRIAKLLDATVQGDDGEEYLGDRWVSEMAMDMTTGEPAGHRVYRGAERR